MSRSRLSAVAFVVSLVLAGPVGAATMGDPEWQAWYQRAQQFMVGGHREILHLVE